MIIRDLLQMLRRGWGVVAVVLLATAAFGVHLMATSGLYTSRVQIVFTLPDTVDLTDDGSTEPGIITFAATVATEADQNGASPRYADADARAFGAGVRQGVFIGVPDVGGQWAVVYRRAVIDVDVVGPTKQWVQEQQKAALDRVITAADVQQDAIGIAAEARLLYTIEPFTDDIEYVAPGGSSQVIALGALAVAGLMVAVSAAGIWDKARLKHSLRGRRRAVAATHRPPAQLSSSEGNW